MDEKVATHLLALGEINVELINCLELTTSLIEEWGEHPPEGCKAIMESVMGIIQMVEVFIAKAYEEEEQGKHS